MGEKMKGNIFSIEEFSVFDGPGIRTTVFLKGCPLKCSWCHNPEGQNYNTEIIKTPNGCIGCGNCIKTSIIKNGIPVLTEESIKKCPQNLIKFCGEIYESEDLCNKLLKNKRILQNGGGVTFSGGEPFVQKDFLFEMLSKLKNNLHTAIQTSGYCDEEVISESLNLANYFLFDIKLANDDIHKKYTGVSNKIILNNLSLLAKSEIPFTIRTPLIPGVTDTEENIKGIAEILINNNINYIELLPYNKMAGGKYKMLGRKYTPDFDDKKEVIVRTKIFERYNIKTKIM